MSPTHAEEAKWKRFEKLTAEIQKSLSPDATVTHNDSIVGTNSGVARQLDITVRRRVGQFDLLVVIECKDHREPCDVGAVEAFASVLEDVKANKGAMISAGGFTKAATTLAVRKGIDLFRLVDTQSTDWRVYVAAPVVVEVVTFVFSLTFAGYPEFWSELPTDYQALVLYDQDRQPVNNLGNLVAQAWNDGRIPEEPGEYEGIQLGPSPCILRFGDQYVDMQVKVNAIVGREYYFGHLPIEQLQGFSNEIHGGVHTRGFRTAKLEFATIRQTWQQIDSAKALAIEPLMRLGFKDYYEYPPFRAAG